jgi:hypothetical protein
MSEEKSSKQEKKKEKQEKQGMSLQEAKAYRASLHKETAKKLDEHEKREQFRLYWAENKYKFGKAKDLEEILWVHLKSAKLDDPENFEAGLAHFGLKKIR